RSGVSPRYAGRRRAARRSVLHVPGGRRSRVSSATPRLGLHIPASGARVSPRKRQRRRQAGVVLQRPQSDSSARQRSAEWSRAYYAARHRALSGHACARGAGGVARFSSARHAARPAQRSGRLTSAPGRPAARPAAPTYIGPRALRHAQSWSALVSPRLSLVIPAYNEQARLPYTLSELEAYICREQIDCEVVVVDNGSQDATSAVVQQAAVRFPALRLLATHRQR